MKLYVEGWDAATASCDPRHVVFLTDDPWCGRVGLRDGPVDCVHGFWDVSLHKEKELGSADLEKEEGGRELGKLWTTS